MCSSDLFGHGFNIRFGYIEAPAGVDVALVAPKGPGHTVRREYQAGRGVPVIVAVEKDASGKAWDIAWSYSKGLGALRAGAVIMQANQKVPIDIVLIVQSLVVLFIAAPPLVRFMFGLPDPEKKAAKAAAKGVAA